MQDSENSTQQIQDTVVVDTTTVKTTELEEIKAKLSQLEQENINLKERLNPKPIMDQRNATPINFSNMQTKANEVLNSMNEEVPIFANRKEELKNYAETLLAAKQVSDWDNIELDGASKNAYAWLTLNNWNIEKFVNEYEPWLQSNRSEIKKQLKSGEPFDMKKAIINDKMIVAERHGQPIEIY